MNTQTKRIVNIEVWEGGKKNEIAFWKHWLATKSNRYQHSRPLWPLFDFMIGDKKEVTIANLGAGAMNLLGDTKDGVKVTVISSDLLADEYQKIRQELKINAPTSVETEDMEQLTYPDHTFDIVFCANALDHGQDPYQALQEMVRICKPGGWIYLRHIAHEGKRHNYRDLHQWNLDITESGDCQIWTNTKFLADSFLLSDIYPGFTTDTETKYNVLFVRSFVQKKNEY